MKQLSSGKVRDIYDLEDGRLVIVTSDRISAFDVIMNDTIPNKGIVLNKLSAFWFEFTRDVIPNHMITIDNHQMPKKFLTKSFKGRSMMVKKLKMLPVECIVRGYLTGSGLESYNKTGSVCGIKLPDGLVESSKLPEPIYTPTTKADIGLHDEHITFEDTVNMLGEERAKELKEKSIELYTTCADYARENGVIIADTKFEFGVDENDNLVLADEVLTPDSSRFWDAVNYSPGQTQKSFDKQYLRDWLKGNNYDKVSPPPELPPEIIKITMAKYRTILNILTGTDW